MAETWTPEPTGSGYFWVNSRERDGTYSTVLVFIDEKDKGGLLMSGLHYYRHQFPESEFNGPVKPPPAPVRKPKDEPAKV